MVMSHGSVWTASMSEEQREAIRRKAGSILYHALGNLQAHEDPDLQQMSRDARQVRTLACDVLQIVSDSAQEAEAGPTPASCFDKICQAAQTMQRLDAEDFHGQCLHLASLCLQATRQIEEMLLADGIPTAIVSEEPGGDFYIPEPESGTEAESGAITAPTRTADPRDAFVDSATHAEPHEILVDHPSLVLREPREGQVVAQRQGLESQLQQMRAEQADDFANLAEALHKLGCALLEASVDGEYIEEAKALDSLRHSLQIKRFMHERADHPSIARTLNQLGHASSILGDRQQATQFFLESLEMSQRLQGGGGAGEVLATLYRLSNEHVLSGDFDQARVIHFFQESLDITIRSLDMYRSTEYVAQLSHLDEIDKFLSNGVNQEYEECLCWLRNFVAMQSVPCCASQMARIHTTLSRIRRRRLPRFLQGPELSTATETFDFLIELLSPVMRMRHVPRP